METCFNVDKHDCLSVTTDFLSALPHDAPCTPTSSPHFKLRGSGPLDLNDPSNATSHWVDASCQTAALMPSPVGSENHPMHQEYVNMDYRPMVCANTAYTGPMSLFTSPSTPVNYTDMSMGSSFMMAYPQALSSQTSSRSGSMASVTHWSCPNCNPASIAPQKSLFTDYYYPQTADSLRESNKTCQMESPREMPTPPEEPWVSRERKALQKSTGKSPESFTISAKIIHKATSECGYLGCTKAFRRVEHLKRHKQTHHGEGPNRFSCEFCGKDNFNRYDNLQTHRRLHARENKRHRSIRFVPAAVPIIEEERIRRRRGPFISRPVTA